MDLSTTEMKDVLKLAADTKTVMTPTAVVLESLNLESEFMQEQKKYYSKNAWAVMEKRAEKPMIPDEDKILKNNMLGFDKVTLPLNTNPNTLLSYLLSVSSRPHLHMVSLQALQKDVSH